MNYHDAIVRSLTQAIAETVRKYDGTITVATAVGCLEIVKQSLILEHSYGGDDLGDTKKEKVKK